MSTQSQTETDLEYELRGSAAHIASFGRTGSPVLVGSLLTQAADEIARLREERDPAQWRPIDTAPKDGTQVLLWKDEVYSARWMQSEVMGPVWATPDGHVIFRATYWMPAPSAPASLTREEVEA